MCIMQNEPAVVIYNNIKDELNSTNPTDLQNVNLSFPNNSQRLVVIKTDFLL